MIAALKKYLRKNVFAPAIKERNVVDAYDIWADNYDHQPGNLMLDLDEIVFGELLGGTDITGKNIADIGCGTGRHWPKIMKENIGELTGFDVSPGMLAKLREKHPTARAHVITDNDFITVPDHTYDLIVSTLTVAHIDNIEEALNAWSRILKIQGDIILTDFHPNALASGGQRTFKHDKGHIAVRNFVHQTDEISQILKKNNFKLVNSEEKKVDEGVRHYYEAQDAMHVFDKFKGSPIIYGMRFRRE